MKYSVYVRKYAERKRMRRIRNISDLLAVTGFMAAMLAGCLADCEDLTAFAIVGCIALVCMTLGGFLYGVTEKR